MTTSVTTSSKIRTLLSQATNQHSLGTLCAQVTYSLWHNSTSPPSDFCALVQSTISSEFSPHVPIIALLYVSRYCGRTSQRNPGKGSEARIWTVALLLALKVNDDRATAARYWPAARLDEVTGIPPSVISEMEREFLTAIDYRLSVSKKEYEEWTFKLRKFRIVVDMKQSRPQKRKRSATVGDQGVVHELKLETVQVEDKREVKRICVRANVWPTPEL